MSPTPFVFDNINKAQELDKAVSDLLAITESKDMSALHYKETDIKIPALKNFAFIDVTEYAKFWTKERIKRFNEQLRLYSNWVNAGIEAKIKANV